MDHGIPFILLNTCKKAKVSETVLEMEAGPSLEGRGLGKKICKEGLAELAP